MLDIIPFALNLLASSGLVGPLILFALGALFGAWFYRYMLKRNPAKLEKWAADAKELAELAKSKV